MLEPRAIGKSLGIGEFALTFDEHFVDFGERSGRKRSAAIGVRLLQRFAVFRGTARERVDGVLKGRKIQVRRNGFHGGRHQRALWIVGGLENAFFNFLVSFANVVLHFL